jgi:Rap1a immunity proteins
MTEPSTSVAVEWCESNDPACIGSVAGVSDELNVYRTVFNDTPTCTPVGATTGRLADMVVKYLRERPEERHGSAALFVTAAIGRAWCE